MRILAAFAAMLTIRAASALTAQAPDDMGSAPGAGRRVRITYENLTAGQVFSIAGHPA